MPHHHEKDPCTVSSVPGAFLFWALKLFLPIVKICDFDTGPFEQNRTSFCGTWRKDCHRNVFLLQESYQYSIVTIAGDENCIFQSLLIEIPCSFENQVSIAIPFCSACSVESNFLVHQHIAEFLKSRI